MIEPPIDERYELAAVKESLTTDERKAAEHAYTVSAFDYEKAPVGSRDWTLFWSGWQKCAAQKAQPPCGADGVWRPIETAPLDGRAVLVMSDNWPGTKSGRAETCNGHNTYVAEWWAESNEWMCYMSLPCEPVCPIAPTHWMPLPDVPSSHPTAPVAPATVSVPDCEWCQDDDVHLPGTWDGACGAKWTFTDGGPKENDVRFCMKCGGHVLLAASQREGGE